MYFISVGRVWRENIILPWSLSGVKWLTNGLLVHFPSHLAHPYQFQFDDYVYRAKVFVFKLDFVIQYHCRQVLKRNNLTHNTLKQLWIVYLGVLVWWLSGSCRHFCRCPHFPFLFLSGDFWCRPETENRNVHTLSEHFISYKQESS